MSLKDENLFLVGKVMVNKNKNVEFVLEMEYFVCFVGGMYVFIGKFIDRGYFVDFGFCFICGCIWVYNFFEINIMFEIVEVVVCELCYKLCFYDFEVLFSGRVKNLLVGFVCVRDMLYWFWLEVVESVFYMWCIMGDKKW